MFNDYIFRHRVTLRIAQLIPSLQNTCTESIKDAFIDLIITLSLCFLLTRTLRFEFCSSTMFSFQLKDLPFTVLRLVSMPICWMQKGFEKLSIMGQEPGLNFAMLDAYDSPEERVTSLKDGKVTAAHNVWEGQIGKYLPGGTMITTRREAIHKTISTSEDPLKLDRWTSILLSGKKGHQTRIVSVHNPIGMSQGALSVNRQQTCRLRTIDDTRTPRDALIEDLWKAVKQWIEDGEHLIIGMDTNEDVRTGKLTKMLQEQDLHNAILSKHPHIGSVTTCKRTE